MAIIKKLIFSLIFVICALIIPALILLLFVDSTQSFAIYVIVYGIIIFGTLGYVIANINSSNKELIASMEEIKKQNAAIAYKMTKGMDSASAPLSSAPEAKPEQIDSANVPLNPAEPLIPSQEPKKERTRVIDDNFDDFK